MLKLPYDPEIPLPGTQEKQKHTTVQTHAHQCSQQHYSPWPKKKQRRCPATYKWINKGRDMHTKDRKE